MPAKSLLLGLLLIGSVQASAQVVTDGPRATAARDSLLQAATSFRARLEAQTGRIKTQAPRAGKRRQLLTGYAAEDAKRPLWQIKRIFFFNGNIEEVFTAYTYGTTSMRQRTVNGQLTYLRLDYSTGKLAGAATAQAVEYGEYLPANYLRWKKTQYLLPTTIK
ncbi:hypothetical protein [Hymenobacter actinosclerus]|uniref:Uncharacterized protein n=1 Tax=Hymenobacter actinosclerus TaxID=82805 RepID=A0A1I0IYV6_9BACT|nr:hypothetical protein [Hymenobacter actinosclerus]SEU01808.1 hypothetical protein SAMN04487998_3499 [Hymenobacter actinosclerus]